MDQTVSWPLLPDELTKTTLLAASNKGIHTGMSGNVVEQETGIREASSSGYENSLLKWQAAKSLTLN